MPVAHDRQKKNLITLVVSILLAYSVLEIFVWRNLLHHVPLTLHSELGRLKPLAQSSKSGVVPKDYILILGDSYAEGLGDWLMRVVGDGNPDYSASHVIHELSGRDVLTSGHRGGHPSIVNVFHATREFTGVNLYAGLSVDHPDDLVVYYYEGNDINDEMAYINFLPPNVDRERLSEPKYLRAVIDGIGADGVKAAHKRWHLFRSAHLLDTSTKLFKLAYKNIKKDAGNLFQNTDPSFRVRANTYEADWSRYKDSETPILAGGKVLYYPQGSVEGFPYRTPEEIALTSQVFGETIGYLNRFFPGARLWVVYIPSPINVYELKDGHATLRDRIRFAQNEKAGPPKRFTAEQLLGASDTICRSVKDMSEKANATFVDTRSHFCAVSGRLGYLHGPNDAAHLNEKGYRTLARIILDAMKNGPSDAQCQLSETL